MSGVKSALVIANSQYEHTGLRQLTAPTQDAQALAEVLADPGIGGFEVRTLVNQRCADVMHEIEKFYSARTRDDLLLLYFSGHGLKDEDGKLYLATLNTDPQWLRSTAIPDHFVNEVMTGSRSKRQVLLLDCCYSGAFAKALLAKGEATVVLKDHFEGRGRVLLTASDAVQYSFEAGTFECARASTGSVFTQILTEGLKSGEADQDGDGLVSLGELYDYVHDRVLDVTPQQRPMKWEFDVEGEIVIARNPAPFVNPSDLPQDVRDAISSKFPSIREEAIHELERLLRGKHRGLALAARIALETLTQDDSRRVSDAAQKVLAANPTPAVPEEAALLRSSGGGVPPAQPKEEHPNRLSGEMQIEEEKRTRERAEVERVASEKAAAEALAKKEAEQERQARAKAEAERLAQEKVAAERRAREESERLAAQKAEAERQARQMVDQQRREHERAEQERRAREEAARRAAEQAQAERLAREKAERERQAREHAGGPSAAPGPFCPKCGLGLKAGATFCDRCGTQVASPAVTPTPLHSPIAQAAAPRQPPPSSFPAPATTPRRSGSRRVVAVVVGFSILGLGVLGIGLLAYFLSESKSTRTEFNPPSETTNAGLTPPASTSPPASVSPHPPSVPEDIALMNKVVEGMGGPSMVGSIHAIRFKANLRNMTPQGLVQGIIGKVIIYPDRVWEAFALPARYINGQFVPALTIETVVTPTLGFSLAAGRFQPLSNAEHADALSELKTDPIWVAQHVGQPGYALMVAGSEQVAGYSTRILEVNAEGIRDRWYIEPQSGYIVRSITERMGPDGQAQEITDYSDWRSYGGYVQASNVQTSRRGVIVRSGQLLEFEVNPSIDPNRFQKPSGY